MAVAAGSPIERASALDLMQLAADTGPATAQIGALLTLDSAPALPAVRDAFAARGAPVVIGSSSPRLA